MRNAWKNEWEWVRPEIYTCDFIFYSLTVCLCVYIVFSLVVLCVLESECCCCCWWLFSEREPRKIQNHHNICSKRFWTVAAVKRNPWRRVVLFLHHYHPNTEQNKNSNRNSQIHTTHKTEIVVFLAASKQKPKHIYKNVSKVFIVQVNLNHRNCMINSQIVQKKKKSKKKWKDKNVQQFVLLRAKSAKVWNQIKVLFSELLSDFFSVVLFSFFLFFFSSKNSIFFIIIEKQFVISVKKISRLFIVMSLIRAMIIFFRLSFRFLSRKNPQQRYKEIWSTKFWQNESCEWSVGI